MPPDNYCGELSHAIQKAVHELFKLGDSFTSREVRSHVQEEMGYSKISAAAVTRALNLMNCVKEERVESQGFCRKFTWGLEHRPLDLIEELDDPSQLTSEKIERALPFSPGECLGCPTNKNGTAGCSVLEEYYEKKREILNEVRAREQATG